MTLRLALINILICTITAHEAGTPLQLLADVEWPWMPDTPLEAYPHDYDLDGVTYEGFVAYPQGARGAYLPGVLLAHQFMGLGDMEKFRARELASYGYVVFAMDSYGKFNRPNTTDEARAMVTALRNDPVEYHRRMLEGLEVLKSLDESGGPVVNRTQLAANGYCAGGQLVFELARLAADGLVAVAGFHASLSPLNDSYTNRWTARTQVHHAESDTDAALAEFENELRGRNVTHWSSHKYGNTNHGWTDPTSAIYAVDAAFDSHAMMIQFYANIFGKVGQPSSAEPRPKRTHEWLHVVGAGLGGLGLGLLVATGVWCFRSKSNNDYLRTH